MRVEAAKARSLAIPAETVVPTSAVPTSMVPTSVGIEARTVKAKERAMEARARAEAARARVEAAKTRLPVRSFAVHTDQTTGPNAEPPAREH